MILVTSAVVLSRRPIGEFDRLATVFTEAFGKASVRFVGVSRTGAKLLPLCEPGAWSELRLHASARSETAKAVGGRLVASFPRWRGDLERAAAALSCLEMLERLTPDRAPSPEKFRLLCAALAALEESPSPWIPLSFGLRLAELAGVSLRGAAPRSLAADWEALHEEEPAALVLRPRDPSAAAEGERLLRSHVEAQCGRPLRCALFAESLSAAAAAPAPAREAAPA